MIIFDIKIDRRGVMDRGFPRKYKAAMRETFRDAAMYWHREIFQRKFTSRAAAEDQQEPRDPAYLKRKRRIGIGAGKFVNLILSGQTRRFALHGPRITATAGGARIRVDVPNYFIQGSRRPTTPNMVAELKSISTRDRMRIAKRMDPTLQGQVRKIQRGQR